MASEIELKFQINETEASRLENIYGLHAIKHIEQNYLFKDTSEVKYSIEDKEWKVIILIDDIPFGFNLKAKPEEYTEIEKALNELDNAVVLENSIVACRIRKVDGNFVFCYKQPKAASIGTDNKEDYEFEYIIELKDLSPIVEFLAKDPFKVVKDRKILLAEGLKFEIDFFENGDILLECEFKTIEHKNSVDLNNFVNGKNVTNTKQFSNKYRAYMAGLDKLGRV